MRRSLWPATCLTQSFLKLTHRQSLGWDGMALPACCSRRALQSVDDCPRTALPPFKGWLASIGCQSAWNVDPHRLPTETLVVLLLDRPCPIDQYRLPGPAPLRAGRAVGSHGMIGGAEETHAVLDGPMSEMAVAAAVTLPERTPHRGMITACIICATLMQSLDQTIANVALPYMQGSFSASYDEITWVLTSYITAAAIMTAPVGWLAARFGRKHLFVVCIIGFTITSMLCGAAQSLEQIVAFRLLQGVFGAALVPLSQATLLDIYPLERRGFAMAIWGMGVMIGPILGPTLGGYLTEIYNWRYVFYINLPFGMLATLGLMLFLPRRERESHLRFDWFGFVVLSTGIGALQMMLDRGQNQDWFTSREIIDRGRARRPRHLPVPGAHGLGAAAVDPAGAVQGRQLLRRPGDDVLPSAPCWCHRSR